MLAFFGRFSGLRTLVVTVAAVATIVVGCGQAPGGLLGSKAPGGGAVARAVQEAAPSGEYLVANTLTVSVDGTTGTLAAFQTVADAPQAQMTASGWPESKYQAALKGAFFAPGAAVPHALEVMVRRPMGGSAESFVYLTLSPSLDFRAVFQAGPVTVPPELVPTIQNRINQVFSNAWQTGNLFASAGEAAAAALNGFSTGNAIGDLGLVLASTARFELGESTERTVDSVAPPTKFGIGIDFETNAYWFVPDLDQTMQSTHSASTYFAALQWANFPGVQPYPYPNYNPPVFVRGQARGSGSSDPRDRLHVPHLPEPMVR